MGDAGAITDAWPGLISGPGDLWSRARQDCDAMGDAIKAALAEQGVRAVVLKPPPGAFPLVVQMIAWLPVGRMAEPGRLDHRVALKITAQLCPYSEHKIVHDLAWDGVRQGGVTKSEVMLACTRLTANEAAQFALFVLGRAPNPRLDERNNRRIVSIVQSFLPFIKAPNHNPLEHKYRPTLLTTPWLLGAVGVLFLLLPWFGWLAKLLGIGALIAAFVMSRRKKAVAVIYKPPFEPRRPRQVDTWHAVIPIPEDQVDRVRARLFDAARASSSAGVSSSIEAYGYFAPDGYVERDQLVISLRQALVYVHVYGYRGELFVGWEGSLNLACWGETKAISTRREGGDLVEYRSIGPAVHTPNEYDLIDLNFLIELVHRRMKGEILRILQERDILETIDFSIIRGQREAALREPEKKKEAGAKREPMTVRVG